MIITDIPIYDGSQLQERFAYRYFNKEVKRTGNMIAFIAPMKVEAEFMVDLEDLKNKDFIYSDKSMHFILEIPEIDAFAGVCFQRLFNTELASLLKSKLSESISMDGDDILVGSNKRKASVSIAKPVEGALLIHTAININAGDKAPSFAYSTNFNKEIANQFLNEGCHLFYQMTQDIFVATTKIRSIK